MHYSLTYSFITSVIHVATCTTAKCASSKAQQDLGVGYDVNNAETYAYPNIVKEQRT